MKKTFTTITFFLSFYLLMAQGNSSFTISEPEENITNPAVRIRTKTREFTLRYRTAVTVITNSGTKYKSNIIDFKPSGFTLAKNKTEVLFSDIKTLRVLPSRRFIKTFYLPSVVYPVFWTCLRKNLFAESGKCKKDILEIQMVDSFDRLQYGKTKCR